MEANSRPRAFGVAPSNLEHAFSVVGGMDLAGGALLGYRDGDSSGARADVEDATGPSPAVYNFKRGLYNALGVGTRYQSVIVEV